MNSILAVLAPLAADFSVFVGRIVHDALMWLGATLSAPKLRVRKLDLGGESGTYVWGTVQVQKDFNVRGCPDPVTHWTITWDDAPALWVTVPSYRFLWHKGHWTLLER